MNYIEARKYIDEVMKKKGSVPGLTAMKHLLAEMGEPQNKTPIIHVAGTNGKGSVISFLLSILKCAGYKTGVYISPSVFEYRERMQIDGCNITEEDYAGEISNVKNYVDAMERKGEMTPTAFEMETAAAFEYFYKKNCDIAIIETGMGGSEDATNVCDTPLVSVIMSISKDHMQYLGNTLKEITLCKAGIIKNGCPVVLYRQKREVSGIIEKCAREKNSMLVITGETEKQSYCSGETIFSYMSKECFYQNLKIRLNGTYQPENAVVAVETAEVLIKEGYSISREDIRKGLSQAVWHGRFEKVQDNPLIYIDGAHNPGAAERFRETVETYFENYYIVYIMGVLEDKEYDEVIEETAALADVILTVTPDNSRALSAVGLAEAIGKAVDYVQAMDSVEEALKKAEKLVRDSGKRESVIIAFGSLSYLGEVKKICEKKGKKR